VKRKLILNLVLLAVGLGVCVWCIELLETTDKDFGRRHPLFGLLVGGLLIALSVKDLLLLAINPYLEKYPNFKARLNGDFWTFLLGPEIKDRQ
jgi:hypothetical protein